MALSEVMFYSFREGRFPTSEVGEQIELNLQNQRKEEINLTAQVVGREVHETWFTLDCRLTYLGEPYRAEIVIYDDAPELSGVKLTYDPAQKI